MLDDPLTCLPLSLIILDEPSLSLKCFDVLPLGNGRILVVQSIVGDFLIACSLSLFNLADPSISIKCFDVLPLWRLGDHWSFDPPWLLAPYHCSVWMIRDACQLSASTSCRFDSGRLLVVQSIGVASIPVLNVRSRLFLLSQSVRFGTLLCVG